MCKSGHLTNIATAKIANFANSICPSLLKLAELAELAWREKSYVCLIKLVVLLEGELVGGDFVEKE